MQKHYNYFRDYDPSIGRYVESDPIGLHGGPNTYAYVTGRPLVAFDALGLKARICCRLIRKIPVVGRWVVHCFVNSDKDGNHGLHGDWDGEPPGEGRIRHNDPFDNPGDKDTKCGDWVDGCATDDCVRKVIGNYPNPSQYDAMFGPNSNTFAGTVARSCGLKRPSFGVAPGWGNDPAPPLPPPNGPLPPLGGGG